MAAPSTRLLRPKEVGSSGASSARVKSEPGGSFACVKKEPGVTPASFARVKKEHGVPMPHSTKKARRLTEDAARQLDYQDPDDPEEFPGLRATERASFNEVQSGTLEFALAWSRQDAKRAEAKRARPLNLCVNLEEDKDDEDASPSQWRGGDGSQGCST
jgi:hypothetical protein